MASFYSQWREFSSKIRLNGEDEVNAMSSLTDFFDALAEEQATGGKVLAAAIDGLANLARAVQGVISVIVGLSDFLGKVKPAEEQILEAINQLHGTIQAAQNDVDLHIAYLSYQGKLNAIDQAIGPANAVFGSISEIIPKLPNDVLVVDAFEKCLTAVQSLRDDTGIWQVTWAPGLGYSDGWSGNVWPPHNGFVFSYGYSLIQLAHSIFVFLATIAALEPPALTNYKLDLEKAIDKLQNVHDMIVLGLSPTRPSLVTSKVPTQEEVAYIRDTGELASWETQWLDGPRSWPYGAVEEYSGASIMDSHWPFLPLPLFPGSFPDNFFKLLELRIENQKKRLYQRLGFPDLRQIISQLRRMIGQPNPAGPRYGTWSFREAFNILGIPTAGSGAFQSLISFLKATPPFSGRGTLWPTGDSYPPSSLPRSFRSIFTPP